MKITQESKEGNSTEWGWGEGTPGCLLIAYTEPLEKVGSKYFYFLIILKLMHVIQEAVL